MAINPDSAAGLVDQAATTGVVHAVRSFASTDGAKHGTGSTATRPVGCGCCRFLPAGLVVRAAGFQLQVIPNSVAHPPSETLGCTGVT
jgi:hypothetical protein